MKSKVKVRKKRLSPEQILGLLSRWKHSGKTKKQFAQEQGLKYYTLMQWFHRYSKEIEGPAFRELSPPTDSGVFAELENGSLRMRFYQPFPPEYFFNSDSLTVQVIFHSRLRYFLYRYACDMRKGYDGLSGLVRNELKMDPLLGDVFIFFCRHFRKVKVLHWQGDGFAIYSKRLEKGTYEMLRDKRGGVMEIKSEQLLFILSGIILSSVKKKVRNEHASVSNYTVESGVSTHV